MKVWVTIYMHKRGTDTAVYATQELAEQARIDMALEWWELKLDRPMPEAEPSHVIADMYFTAMKMRNEFFEIEEREVIGA